MNNNGKKTKVRKSVEVYRDNITNNSILAIKKANHNLLIVQQQQEEKEQADQGRWVPCFKGYKFIKNKPQE